MASSLQIGVRWSSKVGGGLERVFTDLAASLPGAGIRFVGAVVGPSDLNDTTHGLIHSFAPENTGTVARLRSVRKNLPRLIELEKPDLLASHFALYTAPILDKLRARPFVMHFHGPWAMESKEEGASGPAIFAKGFLERSVYQRADRSIVLSTAFANLLSKNYGVAAESIRVVPGAADLDRFRPTCSRSEARDALGWPKDRPILLSVRRLVNRMGLHQLVESVARIRERVPEVLLYIGGTGVLREALEERVRDLDIGGNVRFLGFIPHENLPLAYRASDIGVVPTASLEGFGLVAAESLAAGTPAMVTPVGGLPEVVADLSNDLIFKSGSPDNLAASLTAALRGEISLPSESACREYAVKSFSRDLMASRVASVYRELVS